MGSSSRRNAVILNSRQNLRPVGSDAWIQNSLNAVRDAVKNRYILLTSIGSLPWEIILYLASVYSAEQKIYLPLGKGQNRELTQAHYSQQFNLRDKPISWTFVDYDPSAESRNTAYLRRDEMITANADVVYPVSVRPDGNLDNHLQSARDRGAEIMAHWKIPYLPVSRPCRLEIEPAIIAPEAERLLGDHIIHWTRTPGSAWPGETLFSYYRAIAQSKEYYARNTLSTLIRILGERKLRASRRHYRQSVPAVAFSGLSPVRAATLMKWRARYREMSFEPYGLALRKEVAEKRGVRRVLYGNPEMYNYLDENDKPYFQSLGTIGNWQPEQEFRHIGDLRLDRLPIDSLAVIVWKEHEKSALQGVFDGRIISLYQE